MKNILLVEDDIHITDLLRLHLQASSYQLTACRKGSDVFDKITTDRYHLIILDIMLPDMNGIEVCRRIREQDHWTPILMLSSLSDETDKVLALELGADDYVTKPFGIFELLARTKALLRREDQGTKVLAAAGEESAKGGRAVNGAGDVTADGRAGSGNGLGADQTIAVLRFRDLAIDREKRKVMIRGQRLELTPKEFDLLWLMAGCPGKTFSRHELLERIWGFAFQEYEHTITAHINRLRIKLEKNLNKPEYILTTWGTGYRFAE